MWRPKANSPRKGAPAGIGGRLPAAPVAGAVLQLILLAALAVTARLGPAGWLAGAAYGLALWALLTRALRRAGAGSLGPADRVTLARATLTGGVVALVADTAFGPAQVVAPLVTLATVALVLDAVDGRVARRTGTVSPLGARFDMEADAFLILVLSLFVAPYLGWWVLAIGAMRYVFAAANALFPWLTAPLPPSMARKTVAAAQGIVLDVAAAGILPRPAAQAMVGLALASLCWSFGRDVGWLYRHRAARPGRGHANVRRRPERTATRTRRPAAGRMPEQAPRRAPGPTPSAAGGVPVRRR